MSSARAVVAEPDPRFGELVASALESAGFGVSRCESGVQFRIELHSLLLPGVESVLLVVTERMLQAERAALAGAAKTWVRRRGRSILGIWTTDLGSTKGIAAVEGVEVLSILEKPFDLRELERIAGNALSRNLAHLVMGHG